MENLNGTGKIISALFLGALVGAALGVLFAPEKGSTTRSNIAEGAKDLTSDIKKKIKEEVDALRKKAERLEDLVEEDVEDLTNNIKKEAEKATKAT